jgi:uncharacterized membrane protein YeaQ/YmgE (transglycosylase-associated protein family)
VSPEALVEAIRPAWVLLTLAGCFWAAIWSAAVPPPFRAVGWLFVAGVVGAAAGQLIADAAALNDPMVGDAHLVVASLASLLTVVVVRRLVA